mgnify:CR=1 FL=1
MILPACKKRKQQAEAFRNKTDQKQRNVKQFRDLGFFKIIQHAKTADRHVKQQRRHRNVNRVRVKTENEKIIEIAEKTFVLFQKRKIACKKTVCVKCCNTSK